MPFIGNQPALSYTSFAKQDFSTSATTSYTLDNPVTNANELALFINFVRQEPTTAYSASGTTLTLTSATSSSDDMYCVYLGKAVQTVNPPNASVGLSQLTASGTKDSTTFLRGDNTFGVPPLGGITETDQYRLTANITSDTNPISSNLERVDNASFGKIGTGMSLSSGIFTFPSTGLYHVMYTFRSLSSASDTIAGEIYVTQNNSSYEIVSSTANGDGGSNRVNTGNCIAFVNVTDTANVKVKFAIASITSGTVQGDTNYNLTCFSFIRLGDSV